MQQWMMGTYKAICIALFNKLLGGFFFLSYKSNDKKQFQLQFFTSIFLKSYEVKNKLQAFKNSTKNWRKINTYDILSFIFYLIFRPLQTYYNALNISLYWQHTLSVSWYIFIVDATNRESKTFLFVPVFIPKIRQPNSYTHLFVDSLAKRSCGNSITNIIYNYKVK